MVIFSYTKYIDRHKILRALFTFYKENDSPNNIDLKETSLEFNKIVILSKLNEEEVAAQLDYLESENEINIFEHEFNKYYYISQKGRVSYNDEKYLITGRKEFRNDTYDIIKTISTILLLIIALITFILNVISTKENSSNIKTLKVEIQKLKDSTKIK